MSGRHVLIAAFSARALAQSARRAGFLPLVVDCFGDTDTRAAAQHYRGVPASRGGGIRSQDLIPALRQLSEQAEAAPTGLVLGAGFERSPKLIAAVAAEFPLIGNGAPAVAAAKSPEAFFTLLTRLGIRHPETNAHAAVQPQGWLLKRTGGSGGMHIRDCRPGQPLPARGYVQRKIAGDAISALGILGRGSVAFAFSRQWTAPTPQHPYRYGGACGSVALDADVEGRLIDACLAVAAELQLVGLVSFDFLVADGEPFLIEINPRPGATLDVFDDAKGTLFTAHVEGCGEGGDPAQILAEQWQPPIARAAAYLYADRGPLVAPDLDWPAWSADRPAAGLRIERGQPVATVIVEGSRTEEAEALCRQRLGFLENMLYEGPAGKEPH